MTFSVILQYALSFSSVLDSGADGLVRVVQLEMERLLGPVLGHRSCVIFQSAHTGVKAATHCLMAAVSTLTERTSEQPTSTCTSCDVVRSDGIVAVVGIAADVVNCVETVCEVCAWAPAI